MGSGEHDAASGASAGRSSALLFAPFILLLWPLLWLARQWSNRAAFNRDDVFFDADPHSAIVHDLSCAGDFRLAHPLIDYFPCAPLYPLRAIGAQFVLLPSPVFSVIAMLVFAAALWLVTDNRKLVFAVVLVLATSFNTMIFGSVPEHLTLDGLLTALAFAGAALEIRRKTLLPEAAWIVLAALAGGLTLTSLVMVFACMLAGGRPAPRAALIVGGVGLALCILPALQMLATMGAATDEDKKWLGHYFVKNVAGVAKRAGGFVIFIGNMFTASDVIIYKVHGQTVPPFFNASLSYVPTTPWPYIRGLLFCALLGWGFVRARRGAMPLDRLALAGAAIIVFYFLLLSVWGSELFLYSQLIMIPCLFLLVAALRGRIFAIPILGLLVALQLWLNTHQVLLMLRGLPPG